MLTWSCPRNPTAIVDQEDRIITVLAGRPHDEGWDHVHMRMSAMLEAAAGDVRVSRKDRRGNFIALSTGVSHGGGQMVSISLICPPPDLVKPIVPWKSCSRPV